MLPHLRWLTCFFPTNVYHNFTRRIATIAYYCPIYIYIYTFVFIYMVMKKQEMVVQAQPMAAVAVAIMLVFASPAQGCSPDGKGCKDCIVKQMKQGCPACTPILHCMGHCLWGGASRSDCIKKCDCNDVYPTLSDCKRCMSKCKCSCVN